ncbi:MAG: sodium:solute symporter [Chlamydiales bacterium]|nr:sodium:solute symporter [Chlamydiales bacterium]
MTIFDFIAFGSIILLLASVGIYKSRAIRSESSYLFGERKIEWAALTATLVMTEFNSATLISFSSLGYAAGFWALIIPCIFLIGLLFYALTVAKKWKAFDGVSVAGFFSQRYGEGLGRFASLLLLLAMSGFSAAYIKSLSLLFLPLFPQLNQWLLSTLLLLIIFLMSLRGGLLAIIRTDLLSLLLMVLFFPLVALFMWKSPSLPDPSYSLPSLAESQAILPLRFVFSLTILTMFTYILAPWYGQKIFAAKSGRVAFWAVVSSAVLVFLLYSSAILSTAFLRYRGFSFHSSEQALPYLINKCLPLGIRGAAYALLFATSATTLTGVWSAMSAMWIGDFLKQHSSEKQRDYKRSAVATLCFAAISLLLANTLVDRVFDKLILANIPIAALSFGLLAGFYWKRASRLGAYLSIAMGCATGVGFYLIYGEAGGYTWYWAVLGIPLTFATGIATSLLPSKKLSTSYPRPL